MKKRENDFMSKTKKPNYNSCYISGMVVDIRDAKIVGEGESWEKIQYKMDVEVDRKSVV